VEPAYWLKATAERLPQLRMVWEFNAKQTCLETSHLSLAKGNPVLYSGNLNARLGAMAAPTAEKIIKKGTWSEVQRSL